MNTIKNKGGKASNAKTSSKKESFGPKNESKSSSKSSKKESFTPKKASKSSLNSGKKDPKKPIKKSSDVLAKPFGEVKERDRRKYIDYKQKMKKGDPMPKFNDDAIRLNKYLSNAGVCSRREADVLIQTGVVTINDQVITELGYKIKPGDVVKYDGGTINAEKKRYVLLNKPKGFLTTMDDPLGRKTVMSLVKKACKERIYPIGRLDKETTGLLLFTNDGDMAKKLTHPRYNAVKIYQVELNKNVSSSDLERLVQGLDLEDGRTAFDKAEFIKDGSAREIGVELHSGKNRIVRRMFEKLGYEVVKLDRVSFSGITKKDLPRGYYRHLTEQEVNFLKMSK